MNTNKAITVVGSSNMDLVVESPRIPAVGETILGTYFFMVPGGKGANQAVAAAKLGVEVFFVAKLGDDLYGSKSLDNFTNAGVNTKYITKTKEAPSGVALISVDKKGNNSIIVVPGANHQLSVSDVKSAESAIQQSKAVICQLEIPIAVVENAANLAKEHNVRFILNPAPAPKVKLSDELLKCVDVLTPNEIEAEGMTGIKVKDDDSAVKACKYLLGRGVKNVIITLGAKGFLLANMEEEVFVPSIEINAIDTTAAGDAFTGGLAAYIAQGKTIKEAAKYANYVAALSVTKRGAQSSLPTKEEVENFMKQSKKNLQRQSIQEVENSMKRSGKNIQQQSA
jgi:ribokinase